MFNSAIHRYVGVFCGLLIVVIGLTGTVITFREQLLQFCYPAFDQVVPGLSKASIVTILERIQTEYPDYLVSYMEFYESPGMPNLAILLHPQNETTLLIASDPYSAKIIAAMPLMENWIYWCFYFHTSLLSGVTGRYLVGLIGLLLVCLSLTGLCRWWPRQHVPMSKYLVFTLRVRSGTVGHDLHVLTGITVACVLLLSGLTGMSMTYKPFLQPALNALTGAKEQTEPPKISGPTHMDKYALVKIITAAQARYPRKHIASAGYDNDLAYVRLKNPDESYIYGKTILWFAPGGSAVVAEQNPDHDPASWFLLLEGSWSLHSGRLFGVFGQTIIAVGGLLTVLLWITGLLIWYRRK